MRCTPAVLISLAIACALRGQAPPNYYASVVTSTPAQLRATLHAVIDDHTRFPYTATATDTWNILEAGQQDPSNANSIVDIYKNASYAKIGGGVGAYNREHSWPKSYGFPNDGSDNYPYTDCFHLKLCDAAYNTARNNRVYAQSTAAGTEYTTNLTNGTGGGSGAYPGNSNWADSVTTNGRWQVWNDRRGDCARAIFYMDVRYEGGTHGVTNVVEPQLSLTDTLSLITASNTGSNINTAYMGMLATLLQWHAADPVDARERAFNDLVYSYQGNRNPFIDHPEWVACLYSNGCGDTQPPAAPSGLVATTGKRKVVLDWADNVEPDFASYRVLRGASRNGPFTQINAAPLTASAYVDNGVLQGATWWYVVRAVDTSNNVSSNSVPDMTRWPLAVPPTTDVVVPPNSPIATFVNEIHYDNAGADTGEFVEIAGAAGTNLSGWTIVAYNGNGGGPYVTIGLSGTIPTQQNGMGTRAFAIPGLQNGAPDGVALVNASGMVVDFVSYEGALTATSGPASGMTASLIPTGEDESTPVGWSLQRQGTGRTPSAFLWAAPQAATLGLVNAGQTLQ
jgi:endonuclease I